MGLLDSLMGNASEVDATEVNDEISEVLADNESVANAYKLIRDMLVITNKRLIFVDKQGMTGKKVSYHSIPYKSVTNFIVETAGTFDTDSELKIWVSGRAAPLELELKSGLAPSVQKALATQMFS
ncbi:PH domain-containing protein [Agaribacter flavus]|uniref:PH domain-containing protein n=1 Tax=Agaribacter flavus TaxID=1902781 RepID=A0ABV7FP66_9ALTE